MRCPYCGGEMKKGFIICDGRRTPSWFAEDETESVALAKFNLVSLFTTFKLESFYCGACRKLVIDAENGR